MVLQYESPVRVYKYPFELVMKAYERRFPTCPLIPVFLDSEILSDLCSKDGSQRKTERRCKIHVDAPYLLKKLAGVDYVFFHQTNDLNLKTRTLDIDAYNESFSSRITLREKCRYFVHPENEAWTCYEQSASLEIHSFFGFESTIEKIAMKQYSQNIASGKEVIEHFIKELKTEGVTFVEQWKPPPETSEDQIESPVKPPNGDILAANGVNGTPNNVKFGGEVTVCSRHLNRQGSTSSCSPTGGECQYMLEAEYIRRYLGNLTLMEESQLVQLKKCFAHLQKQKLPSDTTLLRFLRARDFNIEKAREMLSQSLSWRKKHNVDRILHEYQMSTVISDYFPGGWHHYDKESRPLYILRFGLADVKGLVKSVGEDGLLKLCMHVCEEGLKLTEEATRVSGNPITTWTLLIDLEGLNMRHCWRPGIRALLRIIEILEANYPETLTRVLIVRAPRVFPILWTIISAFIDEKTRSKFMLYGGNDYQESDGLVEYIDASVVPDFLGGPCQTKVKEGGLIPKNLYLPEVEQAKEGLLLGENSIYNSFVLHRGQIYELVISIDEVGSVITWDFDVMKQDVAFNVYCVKEKLETKSPSSPGSEQKSAIDKSWKEGEQYYKVETTLICHDGESVQGSHVAQQAANYVIQWRYHHHQITSTSPSGVVQNHEALIAASNKSHIMYYYEVIHSSHYKGSMTSLQSVNGGFALNKVKLDGNPDPAASA